MPFARTVGKSDVNVELRLSMILLKKVSLLFGIIF
jgi:hypothetical protein